MAVQQSSLHDIYQQVKAIAYGIWRKRWYMLGTTWLVSLLGWALVATMPYKYEASAQIFVDTETILPTIAREMGINVDLMRKVEIVRRTVVTRANLEKIIRRSDYLDQLARTDKDLDALVGQLTRDIRIFSLDEGMFRIHYSIDDDRLSDRQRAEVAKRVVANLLAFFLERNTEDGRQKSDSAIEFIDQKIQEYAQKLSDAETSVAKFQQDNIEYLGSAGSFIQRLDSAKADLRKTTSLIAEAQVTHDTLEQQIKNVPATIREARSSRSGSRGGDQDPLEERIADLEKKLDQLRVLGLKDRHPDVVNVTRQIDALKRELQDKQDALAAELQGSADAGRNSNLTTETPNRLYEQLMLQIIQTRTELQTLKQRESDQRRTVAEMEEKAKRVPEIEAQESKLKRDYISLRQQYNEFVQQKQDLDLRADVEATDEAMSLRVVEEPITPQSPSGPPRLIFFAGVFVGSLIAGIGVALVLSQLRPVVITVDQLRAHFDLPILGNVTKSMSEDENRRRSIDLLSFAGGVMLLMIIFVSLLAFDIFGAPTVG
ncbi:MULTISPECIES: XrtA system polysaccharide chain length determinant [Kordiimonas]|jgi:polysaccharide chain length determinant protein (PEP-CTERM system associated)|uniref:XrtA system polysaccharide chain length determinant n=1 Tax=Kordiimonas TaxID=288021 RepID=UPI00257A5476|nr:XrtA system polysaccharide chain length determinant [Kordiimonas sp. UBA4487]